MKNEKISEVYIGLKKIKDLEGVKLNYAIAKNVNKLEQEVIAIEKSLEASVGFKEYEKARIELAKSHAKKDDNGIPVEKDGRYIMVDEDKFNKEWGKLKLKHKKDLDAREEQLKDFNKLLDLEVPIELFMVDLKDVPENITTKDMLALYPMIKE